jgi:hypothetical protein
MSVLSTLALLMTAAIRPRPPEPAGELIGLRLDNADLRRQVAELREDIAELARAARRDQEVIDIWRSRALNEIPPAEPPRGFGQQPTQAQAQQMAACHHGLQSAGVAQQAGRACQAAQQQQNLEAWCNCAPSRAQVWAAALPTV